MISNNKTLTLIMIYLFAGNIVFSANVFAISNFRNNSITIAENNNDTHENGLFPKTDSGPTTSLPWENDEKFKAAREKCGAGIMMAAYKTILYDPLPGEEYNVHLGARKLSGTIVKSGSIFSLNAKIGPYTEYKGYRRGPSYAGAKITSTIGGGVCKISSTLYNVAILANLPVTERFAHSMPVPYVPYGQDATVVYGVKDLKFKNNTGHPLLIWSQGIDNTLYIAIYGSVQPPKVEWHHEELKKIKAETIYKINPKLKKGEERMVLEGMDGGIVRTRITIENPDGTVTTKNLGKSYYDPIPYIFEKGK